MLAWRRPVRGWLWLKRAVGGWGWLGRRLDAIGCLPSRRVRSWRLEIASFNLTLCLLGADLRDSEAG